MCRRARIACGFVVRDPCPYELYQFVEKDSETLRPAAWVAK